MDVNHDMVGVLPNPDQIIFSGVSRPIHLDKIVPYLKRLSYPRKILQSRWDTMITIRAILPKDVLTVVQVQLELGRMLALKKYFSEVAWPELYKADALLRLSLASTRIAH